jgi:Fe-S-cluster containining protein
MSNITNIDKKIYEAIMDALPEKLKFNMLVPCRRCGWCCHNCNAGILSEELVGICKHLNIDQHTFREKYGTKDTKDNPNGVKLIIPCPFLDNDNNCAIYHIRPISCAMYPFSTTLLTIKPCEKGLEMYRILEKWYIEHDDGTVNVNSKTVGKTMKSFYDRNKDHNVKCIDDIDNPMEIDDIIKDDSIKSHGIIVIPDKKGLKRICKYLKKQIPKTDLSKQIISNNFK